VLTWLQQFCLVQTVQALSLLVGVQRTPPELVDVEPELLDEVVTPLHGPPHAAATHELSAWVTPLGAGHCVRQKL
jgi:hypothetical protein